MINFSILGARPLTLLICSGALLVGGCATIERHEKTPVCFSPGTVSESQRPCFYILEITEFISEGVVRARVPDTVFVYNAKHSAYTALGGMVGFSVNRGRKGNPVYEFNMVNPNKIELKPRHTYEFRGITGKASLEVVGPPREPEDQGKDQGKHPDQISENAGTELYARHSPQCCMCDACQSGCVCAGQGNCPWCATADVTTLLASASINKDTVDVRSGYGLRQLSATNRDITQRFLALMGGSRAHSNISMRFIASYKYDQQFVPSCLIRSA